MHGVLDIRSFLLTGFLLVVYFPKDTWECSRLDEVWCPHTGKCASFLLSACRFNCPYMEKSCDDGKRCYEVRDRCDGIFDCADRVDELYCCRSDQKACDDGTRCYSFFEECDGVNQCSDGKDEKSCNKEVVCPSYSCNNYDNSECYSSIDRCDGRWDCSNGADEEDCPSSPVGKSPGGPSMGTIIGIIVGVIAFVIVVLCCKKAVQSNDDQTDPAGSVAYHSAANYRQSGNFQVSHNYINPTEGNSSTPYPVAVGDNTSSTSTSIPAPFQSSHHYNDSSTGQPSNPYPGYTQVYGPTASDVEPSAPSMEPPLPSMGPSGPGPNGYMGPNAALYGPSTDSSLPYPAAATNNYPYPVATFPPPPSASGDTEPSPVTAPPPSYESLYPENKTNT